MKLPIPFFHKVKETYYSGYSIVLIAPDDHAGKLKVFSVIRIMLATGKATCIGRELSINIARMVATQPFRDDGKPLE